MSKSFHLIVLPAFLVALSAGQIAAQYSVVHEFNVGGDGSSHPIDEMITQDWEYGAVLGGGAAGYGYFFRINTEVTGVDTLLVFDESNIGIDNTSISFTIHEGVIYGTVDEGGASADGMIFSVNLDGTGFTNLHDFDHTNGRKPSGRMTIVDTKLIGTTLTGGSKEAGIVFSYDIFMSSFQKLYDFDSINGATPTGGLLLSDTVLYGLTTHGGLNYKGVLFKINKGGFGFEKLHDFADSTGSHPMGSLVRIDSAFYGTCSSGGANGMGNVFRTDTTGEDYEVVVSFDGINGNSPRGSICMVANRLYGTTYYGGVNDKGVLFTMYKDRPGYQVLYDFSTGSGYHPETTPVAWGSLLLGTTTVGGPSSGGALFSYQTGYPADQACCLGFGNIQTAQVNVHWARGSGDSVVVFMKKDSTGMAYPKDSISYTDSSRFGKGSQIDNSEWYCVYNGPDDWVQVTGLEPGTTYRVMVVEYNGGAGTEKYLVRATENNPWNVTTREGVAGFVESFQGEGLYSTAWAYSRDILADGCTPIIAHGYVWATHSEPTLADNVHIDGSDVGSFKTIIGNQEPNTTYYARTFILYPNDTIYSEGEASITTFSVASSFERAYEMLIPPLSNLGWGQDPNNWVFGSIAGGDAYKGSEENDQFYINDILRYDVPFWNSYTLDKWSAMYEGITRCTDAITAVTDSLAGDPVGDTLVAELRFLRAFYYFELIKVFGPQLPWIDETNWLDNEPVPMDSPIWTNVENDFLDAIADLPEVSPSPGRVNVWAARAFYAKLLLYQEKYPEALTVFNDVINNGKTTSGESYALLSNFDDNFNMQYNNSFESVFAQQPEVDTAYIGEGYIPIFNNKANPGYCLAYPYGNNAPGGCCGFFQPSQSLVNSYLVDGSGLPMFDPTHQTFPFNTDDLKNDEGLLSTDPFFPDSLTVLDPRLDWTVGRRGIPYLDWGIHPGEDWIRDQAYGGPYSPKKNVFRAADTLTDRVGKVNGWAPGSELNHNLMRFADVLLMAAECEVELGNLETARNYVNQVRTRAGVSRVQDGGEDAANYQVGLYTSFPDQEYAREAVRIERKLELAMEGHRFFDLSRWGYEYADKELNSGYLAYELVRRSQFTDVVFDSCDLYFTFPHMVTLNLPRAKRLDDPPFKLSANSTIDIPITYETSDPTVVDISGDSLYIVGYGEATVTARQTAHPDCEWGSIDEKVITIYDMSTLLDASNYNCETGSAGSIDLTVTGGAVPYEYSWSNDSTGEDISGLYEGEYIVSIIDSNYCTITDTADIVLEGALIIDLADTAGFCPDDSIIITGPAGYDHYGWSTGAVDTIQILVDTAGVYWLQVTDSLSCTGTDTITVVQWPVIDIHSTLTDYDCEKDSAGSIDLTVTGGMGPLSYLWSNDSTSEDLTGLTAGEYIILVTDAKSCSLADTLTIVNTGSIILGLADTAEFCPGDSIMLNGPIGYDHYEWSATAIDTYQVRVDTAGAVWVEVTNSLGCTGRDTIMVIEMDSMEIDAAIVSYDCEDGTAGSIDLAVTGGTAPYTYLWSDLSISEDRIGLYPGEYIVTVTDSKSCYKPDTITLGTLGYLQISLEDSIEFCDGESEIITAPAGYSDYEWSNGISDTNQITVDETGLIILMITDTLSCENIPDTVVVIEHDIPAAPVAEDKTADYGATVPDLTAMGDNIRWYARADSSYLGDGSAYPTGETASGTYLYLVNQTLNNCESPYTQVSLTIRDQVIQHEIPDTSICAGDTVIYEVDEEAGHVYSWTVLGTGETVSEGASASLSPGVTTDYVFKDSTTATTSLAIDTFKVTVNQLPVIEIELLNDELTLGSSTAITATGAQDYTWSPAEGLNKTTGPTVLAQPDSNISYTITGISADGCKSDTTIDIYVLCEACSDEILTDSIGSFNHGCTNRNYRYTSNCTWTIFPSGVFKGISIKFDTASFDIKSGDELRIYPGSEASGTPLYTLNNDNLPPDSIIIFGNAAFIHLLSYTSETGLGFQAQYRIFHKIVWPEGLDDSRGGSVNIFPNPNQGSFTLEMDQVSFSEVSVEIFSSLGQKLWNRTLYPVNGTVSEIIEMGDLQGGIYYLRIVTDEISYHKTIILE